MSDFIIKKLHFGIFYGKITTKLHIKVNKSYAKFCI